EPRRDLGLQARRADPVAEPGLRVPGDVALHGVPEVLVVAHLPAVRADGDYLAQRPDLGQRALQLAHQSLSLLLRLLARGDVARRGVYHTARGIGGRVPVEPPERAVLAQVAVLEPQRLVAVPHAPVLV